MSLAPLKYKNYTWPHNPRTYFIDYQKNIASHEYPYSNLNDLEDLGMKPREMGGEGEFIGEGAYEEFKKLASVFYSEGPGPLVHPLWDISNAIFKSLKVEQEPTPDYVKYSFSFIEDSKETSVKEVKKETKKKTEDKKEKKVKPPKSVKIKQGDTLWVLSRKHNTTIKEILKKNPGIKNPNLIYTGDTLKI